MCHRVLTVFSSVVLIVAGFGLPPIFAQEGPQAEVGDASEGDAAEVAAEVELIQQQIASYIKAFNKGDAEAVAKHWTKEGEFLTSGGTLLEGYDALKNGFAKYFSETKSAKIELIDPQIEILSPSIARETGTTRVVAPEQEPSDTSYQAMYVKTAAGWKLDSVREQPESSPAPSHYQQLQALEWMVGTWVDESGEMQVETTCRWTTNQNFLVRSFKVYAQDGINFEGTQVIGWDPSTERIRSWMFDSDGGFGTGVWSENGNGWTVHKLNILPDGKRASATHMYEQLDDNSLEFRSVGRQVDGELLPSIEPIRVVRRGAEAVAQP